MKKLIGILLITIIFSSCSKEEAEEITIAPKKVNTITLEEIDVNNYAQYTGYLLANEVKKYSFTLGGQISQVNVKKGDQVKKGDVLAILNSEQIDLGKNNAVTSKNLAENESKQANINIDNLQESMAAENVILNQLNDALSAEELKLTTLQDTYEKNINQLEDNYNLLEDTYNKNKILVEEGIMSQTDFDQIENQYNNTKDELDGLYKDRDNNVNLQQIAINNAKSNIEAQKIKINSITNQMNSAIVSKSSANLQINQAQIGVDQYQNQLNDTTLEATMDGSVVDVVMQEGEVTGAGTPVVIVKSDTKVVSVGVAVGDYENININDVVTLVFDDVDYSGIVTSIASYPDETTKTYEIQIETEENYIPLGSLVNVKFPLSTERGSYIPINCISNIDGVDYVYTVTSENLVVKEEVTLKDIQEDTVRVTGLNTGTKIILENYDSLQENEEVIID